MKVAAYLRVSTKDQTADNQLPSIHAWVKSHGGELAEIYRENESAWKAGHQKELSRLLEDVRSGRRKYDVVLVWAFDRLTREGISTLLSYYNAFTRLHIRLISIQESWSEVPTEFTPIFLAMMGFFANWDSSRKSERVKAGQARAVKEGKHIGRPAGKKDSKPRSKSGYYRRYEKK